MKFNLPHVGHVVKYNRQIPTKFLFLYMKKPLIFQTLSAKIIARDTLILAPELKAGARDHKEVRNYEQI